MFCIDQIQCERITREGQAGTALKALNKPYLMTMLFFIANITLIATFVLVERRHLMVWRVFAPKYCFEGIFTTVVNVLLVLSLVFVNTAVQKVSFVRDKSK